MRLTWLELTAFRSYERLEWGPDPGVNLLIGPNGAGKTNLLEAIAYLARLKSFRGVSDEGLVRDGAAAAYIRSAVARDADLGEALIEIEIPRSGPRRTQLDRLRLRRASDLIEVLRVVTFLPDDLDIVKRGPGGRRDLIDEVAVQLRPAAALDLAEFERALRQRNAFLKAGARDDVTLAVWDERLSQAGGKVMARRAMTMHELRPYFGDAYRTISGSDESLGLAYGSQWEASDDPAVTAGEQAQALAQALTERHRYDRERRVTTVGPHRDDPVLTLDGHQLRVHGSQGEQRTTALALRLASHAAIGEQTGTSPLLLLDDVFSELDEDRAERLAAALPPAQTFITSARPEDVPVRGRTWRVGDGHVQEAA